MIFGRYLQLSGIQCILLSGLARLIPTFCSKEIKQCLQCVEVTNHAAVSSIVFNVKDKELCLVIFQFIQLF